MNRITRSRVGLTGTLVLADGMAAFAIAALAQGALRSRGRSASPIPLPLGIWCICHGMADPALQSDGHDAPLSALGDTGVASGWCPRSRTVRVLSVERPTTRASRCN